MRGIPELTQTEALAFSVVAFVSDLAGVLGRSFEEVDELLGRTPFELWSLVNSPDGWTSLADTLVPPEFSGHLSKPTIH